MTTDQVSFSDFFAKRYERLVRACALLTGRAEEGEDLAQEAMARVLERWDRVSQMDDPEGYLYRTALNLHRKALRRLATAARRHVFREPAPDDPDATGRRLDLLRAIQSAATGAASGARARRVARLLGGGSGSVARDRTGVGAREAPSGP